MNDISTHYYALEAGSICHEECAIAEMRRMRDAHVSDLREIADRLGIFIHAVPLYPDLMMLLDDVRERLAKVEGANHAAR